jgi:hypothetical protein
MQLQQIWVDHIMTNIELHWDFILNQPRSVKQISKSHHVKKNESNVSKMQQFQTFLACCYRKAKEPAKIP